MSAAYVLATAAVTPLYARLFDRFGQRKVGPVILTVQIIVMLGFAFAALMRVPIPLLFVLAVVMGMTQFSFGALVRTRWAYVLARADKEDLLNTAYALESAIDEIVFIFGPILAAFLAASLALLQVFPSIATTCRAMISPIFSLNFCRQRAMNFLSNILNILAKVSCEGVELTPKSSISRSLYTSANAFMS